MGYLPLIQTSLEDITLVTGSGCPHEDEDGNAVDLSTFYTIRRISWIGLQSDFYIQALRVALETNSNRLTHLRLEYVNQSDGSFGEDDDTDDDDEDEDSGN